MVVFVLIIHFHTSSHIALILNITVVINTQSCVHDFNVIFLTNQLDKVPERAIWLIWWFWKQTDKQVLLKVVGTRSTPQNPLILPVKKVVALCRPP